MGEEEFTKEENQTEKAYYCRQENKNRPLLALYYTDEPCYKSSYA